MTLTPKLKKTHGKKNLNKSSYQTESRMGKKNSNDAKAESKM